jgi:hypothetical protein
MLAEVGSVPVEWLTEKGIVMTDQVLKDDHGLVCAVCEKRFGHDEGERLTVRMVPDAPGGDQKLLLCIRCAFEFDREQEVQRRLT